MKIRLEVDMDEGAARSLVEILEETKDSIEMTNEEMELVTSLVKAVKEQLPK